MAQENQPDKERKTLDERAKMTELERIDEVLLKRPPEDLVLWQPLVVRREALIRELAGREQMKAALERGACIDTQLRIRKAAIRAELERLFQSRFLLRALSGSLAG